MINFHIVEGKNKLGTKKFYIKMVYPNFLGVTKEKYLYYHDWILGWTLLEARSYSLAKYVLKQFNNNELNNLKFR